MTNLRSEEIGGIADAIGTFKGNVHSKQSLTTSVTLTERETRLRFITLYYDKVHGNMLGFGFTTEYGQTTATFVQGSFRWEHHGHARFQARQRLLDAGVRYFQTYRVAYKGTWDNRRDWVRHNHGKL